MVALLFLLLNLLVSPFKSTGRLEAEIAALRQQVVVLQRNSRGRVPLTNGDRMFFVLLYATILMEVRTIIADLPVIIHGYDYAIPQPGGRWFGKPMDQLGIPADAGKRAMIVRAMMDDFHARLTDFARAYSHVTYVDLRGTVPGTEWFDELHPTTKAFGYVAAKIAAEIAKIRPLVS
jgi:hypothetical protein